METDLVSHPHKYIDSLPLVEGSWLKEQVTRFWESADDQYECVDNNRIARVGQSAEVDRYDEIHNDGCCGFMDTTFGPSPLGHTYRYGFNYGH